MNSVLSTTDELQKELDTYKEKVDAFIKIDEYRKQLLMSGMMFGLHLFAITSFFVLATQAVKMNIPFMIFVGISGLLVIVFDMNEYVDIEAKIKKAQRIVK